jgi:chemotaxis methyl-accepting protein methylase
MPALEAGLMALPRASLASDVPITSARCSGSTWADTYLGYLDHVEVDPQEFTQLFNTILINVTGFFRDPPTWEFLSGEVLSKLVAVKGDDEPIRIWSAGCASGGWPTPWP